MWLIITRCSSCYNNWQVVWDTACALCQITRHYMSKRLIVFNIPLCYIALNISVSHSIISRSVKPHYMAQCCTALWLIVLHCIMVHSVALHYGSSALHMAHSVTLHYGSVLHYVMVQSVALHYGA